MTETFKIKRLLITGVFCLLSIVSISACTDANKAETEPEQHAREQQAQTEPEPLLSLSELLNADDVKSSLAIAAKEGDQDAIALWQQRLLEAGQEVQLRERDMNLLRGEQGKVFLSFQGMKTNYQQEFEHAFYHFEDVDAVYEKYPAFESLHSQSKDLVDKRDTLVETIAESMRASGLSEEDALKQAREEWQSQWLVLNEAATSR
uniref:hypothetical protein n=1 Tax=Ningiella ruwaisensis TaxID=2364274 RepID=UPI0010A0A9B7|nr:hypothetical protein [Ningiella ruwaisensis]